LLGAYPVNASPARTAAIASSGGRTQVAGLAATAAVILLVPAAGLLKNVPLATLAAVLVFGATRIFHGRELLAIARFGRIEFGLALITLLAVALIGVEQGIGVAVGLAILDRTRVSARPKLHVLGRIGQSTSWTPVSADPDAKQIPSVLVVLFSTPLWYANAVHFGEEIRAAMTRCLGPPRVVILDTIGMTDIDFTGSRALSEVFDELTALHIRFGVARASDDLLATLKRQGLAEKIGLDHFFDSVNEAVVGLPPAPEPQPGPEGGATNPA